MSTEGRIGWNCVTGSNDGAAQNYGHDKQPPHDERYDVADEFADVVTRLWEAWEPDAVVLDRDKPMFADGSKVHPVNHEGKYFQMPRAAERAALAAGPRADLPGRRLAARAGLRRRAGPTRSSPKAAAASTAMKAYREDVRRQRRGARPRSRRHQGAVPGLSDRRHHDGGGARAAAAASRRTPNSIWTCSSRACRG